jgi:hypothetical protein
VFQHRKGAFINHQFKNGGLGDLNTKIWSSDRTLVTKKQKGAEYTYLQNIWSTTPPMNMTYTGVIHIHVTTILISLHYRWQHCEQNRYFGVRWQHVGDAEDC